MITNMPRSVTVIKGSTRRVTPDASTAGYGSSPCKKQPELTILGIEEALLAAKFNDNPGNAKYQKKTPRVYLSLPMENASDAEKRRALKRFYEMCDNAGIARSHPLVIAFARLFRAGRRYMSKKEYSADSVHSEATFSNNMNIKNHHDFAKTARKKTELAMWRESQQKQLKLQKQENVTENVTENVPDSWEDQCDEEVATENVSESWEDQCDEEVVTESVPDSEAEENDQESWDDQSNDEADNVLESWDDQSHNNVLESFG